VRCKTKPVFTNEKPLSLGQRFFIFPFSGLQFFHHFPPIFPPLSGHTALGGDGMGKKDRSRHEETAWPQDSLRLEPDKRLCSEVDDVSIRKYPLPSWEEMGVRVLDDCARENIQ
jgi:hypothetical protein